MRLDCRSRTVARALGTCFAVGLGAVATCSAAPPTFTPLQRAYWAFQPIVVSEEGRSVDSFISAKLAAKGLDLAPRAGRRTLIRRATFDLIGLPPTPEEVEAFIDDDSPEAFRKVVDRLLASPHYGERWARHWLDVARYAESDGFEHDVSRPNVWRYRDYVIDAFNSDKPYDRFVREQIAGDEMWPESFEARIATAFNRHYPEEGNQKDLMLARTETLANITDVVGSAFMGLTFGCARCHDHKFDPILQRDYYRLQAFFAAVSHVDRFPVVPDRELAEYERRQAIWERETRPIWDELAELLDTVRRRTSEFLLSRYPDFVIELMEKPDHERTSAEKWMAFLLESKDCNTCPIRPEPWRDKSFFSVAKDLDEEGKKRYNELRAKLEELEHLKPPDIARASGIVDVNDDPPATYVLGVGQYASPGEEVQPAFLSILEPGEARIEQPRPGTTGRRTALAKWLTDPTNPLTARVMVNRIWHHHFGRGIVAMPSDFGVMSGGPSHPELLDLLAKEFVESGWSVKAMHRLIMNSHAYQQSSAPRPEAARVDSENRLLWRFPPQRLEAEVLRDSVLSVAGTLNPKVGGESVMPPLPAGMPKPRGGWATSADPADHNRRSVYIFMRRNRPYPMLDVFDFPDSHESCARRNQTMTAPQALTLLNSEQTARWAEAFASRVLEQAGNSSSARVETAHLLAYSRPPDAWEKDAALSFLERQGNITGDEAAAWADYCLMLLNSNEFVYRF